MALPRLHERTIKMAMAKPSLQNSHLSFEASDIASHHRTCSGPELQVSVLIPAFSCTSAAPFTAHKEGLPDGADKASLQGIQAGVICCHLRLQLTIEKAGKPLRTRTPSMHHLKLKSTYDNEVNKQTIKILQGSTTAGVEHDWQLVQAEPKHSTVRLWIAAAVLVAVVVTCASVYLLFFRKHLMPYVQCKSKPCLDHAERLLASIDTSVNPCHDFYAFTCGRWQSSSPHKSVQDVMNEKATQEEIEEVSTDLWNVGKPSRLYQKCLNPEPSDIAANIVALEEIMANLFLTWPMENPQPTDSHPLDVMVELAFKWDINFIFSMEAARTSAIGGILVFRRVYSSAAWVDRFEKSMSAEQYKDIVKAHLNYLSANMTNANCTLLQLLENSFIEARLHKAHTGPKWFIMDKIDLETQSFKPGIWLQYLELHSEDMGYKWSSHDSVLLEDADILSDVEKLFKKHTHVELLTGIAWMFIQSHLWAVVGKPKLMFESDVEKKCKYACLEYVNLRLGISLSAEHLNQRYPTKEARHEISSFLLSVKSEFITLMKNSSWIDVLSKHTAEQKITSMNLNLLPAEQFFDPAKRLLLYQHFPLMNDSGFFGSWLQASRIYQKLHSHEHFRDVYKKRRTFLYEPYSYSYLLNDISAGTVALEPPMFYKGGPYMINYAGAATRVAREIAKSFDPQGVHVDNHGDTVTWWGMQHSAEYRSRATCDLGEGAPATMGVFPVIPAIEASYAAYKRVLSKLWDLEGKRTDLRISGLERYDDDMLFFLTYCYALCSKKGDTMGKAECNVPLKHFDQFGEAFRCSQGSPMRAAEKCTFFSS
ncbi:neprilysin-1-like isoform X3 [Dermacentor albipictus]|uniref:neprilysin-1-like isoform X3 n=1 Tax=Dermacentor albipictus TaxID=60249 RepID=UPI0031FE2E2A